MSDSSLHLPQYLGLNEENWILLGALDLFFCRYWIHSYWPNASPWCYLLINVSGDYAAIVGGCFFCYILVSIAQTDQISWLNTSRRHVHPTGCSPNFLRMVCIQQIGLLTQHLGCVNVIIISFSCFVSGLLTVCIFAMWRGHTWRHGLGTPRWQLSAKCAYS